MTYKLEPIVEKISSPVVVIKPDGECLEYESGASVSSTVFDRHYTIETITAVNDKIEINLKEAESAVTESFF